MVGQRPKRHWKRWVVIGFVTVAVALVGGPFAYIHFIEGKAPPPLTLGSVSSSPGAGAAANTGQDSTGNDGTWTIAGGSVVGYRVNEVLFGQSNVAVGRTGSITGSITVSGTTISAASFTVDMTTVTSDRTQRDGQFNGRIMQTSTYPTATFTLTKPIDLGSIPATGVQHTFQATGNLTLHGVMKVVTFQVTGEYTGSAIQFAGAISITFAGWNISNPSFGPVTTEDHGVLEFSLNLTHA